MKIIVGKNYIFMVDAGDIHLTVDYLHDMCKEIDYRVDEISRILNIDKPLYSTKTKYFIKYSTNTLGKFKKNLIYCESPHWNNLYEPFVHEECHDITFRNRFLIVGDRVSKICDLLNIDFDWMLGIEDDFCDYHYEVILDNPFILFALW